MTFRMVPDWLIEHADASDGAIRCWLVLCLVARGATSIRTSIGTIAKAMRCTTRHAQRRMRELESLGLVAVTAKLGELSVYTLADPRDGIPLTGLSPPTFLSPPGDIPVAPPLTGMSPPPRHSCHPSPDILVTPDMGGRGAISFGVSENLETKRDREETGERRSARAREGQEQSRPVQGNGNGHDDFYAGFKAWFSQYPTPRRTNERMALARWRDTMSDDDRAAALEAVPRFAAVFANSTPEGQRFCRAADRWLRECCWREDESTWAASMAGPTATRSFENKVAPEHRRKDMSEYFDQ